MADPLSVTASVLAVATAAIGSVRLLCDTIKSFQNRDKTLRRLHHKLQDLATVLESLSQVIDADESMLTLLEGPIDRCREICDEFKQSVTKFHGKSNTGLLDWTKLEFMKGDIRDFIDTIEGYKSTITVGLGTITLRTSKASLEVLQEYEEMVKDTAYNLEIHLQDIDRKLSRYSSLDDNVTDASIDLEDEKAVTQQCLRICKDASFHIELLAAREPVLRQVKSSGTPGNGAEADFEAQVLTRQAFEMSKASLSKVIDSLGDRLHSVLTEKGDVNDKERTRLQQDIEISRRCLQVCNMAGEVSHQKIHTIGEVIAEDDSDQVVVTTLADLFSVKKATSKGHSAQLVATLTPENFDNIVAKRYSSRFGASLDQPSHGQTNDAGAANASNSQSSEQAIPSQPRKDVQVKRGKPSPNEVKKRSGYGDE